MSEVLSIMIDNRAEAQNDGPHGYWLDLPTTAEKLQEAMREIHISTDNPQDFFIAGFSYPEDRHLAIPYDMVLTADVDELNFLAARLDRRGRTEFPCRKAGHAGRCRPCGAERRPAKSKGRI